MMKYMIKSNTNKYKIPLVGNRYQKRKPNRKDTEIILIKEDENEYDNKAVAVYSKTKIDNEIKFEKLGFIIRDKATFIRENYENITIRKLVRSKNKNKDNLYYYYISMTIS